MPNFPLMRELPGVLDTFGWVWERYNVSNGLSDDFWQGTDREGNKWLTKLRGDFPAYREIVFARLAQKMGWSCQSSICLRFDKQSADVLEINSSEMHAAHWFMDEHEQKPCSAECSCASFTCPSGVSIKDLGGYKIQHILDWPKSAFAACLFGANDGPDSFFSSDHTFVIIDSEQMFSSSPCPFAESEWWVDPDGPNLAKEICREYLALTPADIEYALAVPEGVKPKYHEQIRLRLEGSQQFAQMALGSASEYFVNRL